MFCKYFLPLHDLSSCPLNSVFQRADKAQFIKFFFQGLCFWGCNQRLKFPLCLLKVTVQGFTFRTVITVSYFLQMLRHGSIFNLVSGCPITLAPSVHCCTFVKNQTTCVGLFLDSYVPSHIGFVQLEEGTDHFKQRTNE